MVINQQSENSPIIEPPTALPSRSEGYGAIAVENAIDYEDDTSDVSSSFMQDVMDTFHLAFPIFISRVSYVGVRSFVVFFYK
jgi:hypothetical protein